MAASNARGRVIAAVLLAALAAVLVLGLARRRDPAHARWSANPWGALDPDADYRRRLLTLALDDIDTYSVEQDEFVGGGVGARAVGALRVMEWIAQTRSSHADDGRGHSEAEFLDAEQRVVRALELGCVLAALAAAALVLAAARSGASRLEWRHAGAALLAAAVVALSPLSVAREQAQSLRADSAQVLLALLQFGALGLAARGRERIDIGLGAFVGGAFGGAALALGAQAWPTLFAVLVAWLALAVRALRAGDRERLWGAFLVALGAKLAFALCLGALEPRDLLPLSTPFERLELSSDPLRWVLLASSSVCAWRLAVRTPRAPLPIALLVALLVAAPAAVFDERFLAVNHAALALGLGLELSRALSQTRSVAACGALVLALAVWPGDSAEPLERALGERQELHAALERLRSLDPAPGAFNHPAAAADWRVASAAALAGPIAHRARRPVFAVEFDGRASDAAGELEAWLALEDLAEFNRQAALRKARYVLVTRSMLSARAALGAQREAKALERWLDPRASLDGWSLVHSAAPVRAQPDAPERSALALWRRE